MTGTVYIVHCIDTEGPLYESVTATFERLKAIFNLDLEPTAELLGRLQVGAVDLGGLEKSVQKVVDPHLLRYNDNWEKIDTMLEQIMSPSFRHMLPDSYGNGWIFNWFCVDHVEYESNPRRRDQGYLNVFDHYQAVVREKAALQDRIYFHFHPHNFRHEAHRCATHWWSNSHTLFQVLCRRVIDRLWFPAAHRPGFHVTRPDSHWFLEQFIPFDYASQAIEQTIEDDAQFGLKGGQLGDWRRAPVTWTPYHPSSDDYQVPGDCRRWIARCLNIGTRFRLITEKDVRQAFREAGRGQPVVLSVTNHDFRDMAPDVDEIRRILKRVSCEFPDVAFRYSNAVDAMRRTMDLPFQPPCELEIDIHQADAGTYVMVVESQTPTFGPQPWLALKTVNGHYHHDNFDIDVPFHRWQYVFDDETIPLNALDSVGVAANNAYGTTSVAVLNTATGKVSRNQLNLPVSE